MKIIFISKNKERKINLPLSALSFFTQFLPLDKEKLTKKVVRDMIRTLKKYKKLYGSFVLLEVEEDGSQKFKIVV
ncbi:MAG: hypothetical protein IJ308_07600 [Clostridia bacterium]|nr:hypothetical protein [Clostridia bacterium]